MELTVLGMNGPFPAANGATSGYLMRGEKTRVAMDMGSGTLGRLTALMPPEKLDALLLSHWHFDHCSDVLPLLFRLQACAAKPLDVYAPVDESSMVRKVVQQSGAFCLHDVQKDDGSAVAKPKNVIVPIGMKLADVFEQAGGFCAEPKKVLYGGPMMGIAVPDLDQPVLKNTNAVLAMTEADAVLPEPTACIRCGRCIRHCPLRLMPSHIVAAYEAGNMERLAELKVNLCMECGCCSFGCPAHRPLVQTNKLAKAKLAAWRKAQSEKLDAKKEAVK